MRGRVAGPASGRAEQRSNEPSSARLRLSPIPDRRCPDTRRSPDRVAALHGQPRTTTDAPRVRRAESLVGHRESGRAHARVREGKVWPPDIMARPGRCGALLRRAHQGEEERRTAVRPFGITSRRKGSFQRRAQRINARMKCGRRSIRQVPWTRKEASFAGSCAARNAWPGRLPSAGRVKRLRRRLRTRSRPPARGPPGAVPPGRPCQPRPCRASSHR